jgi:hypothetical protein
MIRKEKLGNALYSLHLLLVRARAMACEEDRKKIAKMMDWAELLPKFINSKEDQTEKYREFLIGITMDFPNCLSILQAFDMPLPPEWTMSQEEWANSEKETST